MRMAWPWLLAAGCFHGDVVIRPAHIATVAGELRARGAVELDASEAAAVDSWRATKAPLRLDDRLELAITPALSAAADDAATPAAPPAATRGTARARLSVRELLADCPAGGFWIDAATRAGYPRCVLLGASDEPIVIGHRRFVRRGVVEAGVGLAMIGGLFACAFECDRPWSRISGGVLIASGALVTAAAISAIAQLATSRR
jgi:hypothetical protein